MPYVRSLSSKFENTLSLCGQKMLMNLLAASLLKISVFLIGMNKFNHNTATPVKKASLEILFFFSI